MSRVREGAVIRGVTRRAELLEALLRELQRLDSMQANSLRARIPRPAEAGWFEGPEAELLLEDLLCALTDCAEDPSLYFGAHARARQDFGYWRVDD